MPRDVGHNLAEALDPLLLARRMGILERLTDEEKAALQDVERIRGLRPTREGLLAVGTLGGLVASMWDCFYGRGADERADWERQCERHDPKAWAKRKREIADHYRDDNELEERLKQIAACLPPGHEPQTTMETLALLMFGSAEEATDGMLDDPAQAG